MLDEFLTVARDYRANDLVIGRYLPTKWVCSREWVPILIWFRETEGTQGIENGNKLFCPDRASLMKIPLTLQMGDARRNSDNE